MEPLELLRDKLEVLVQRHRLLKSEWAAAKSRIAAQDEEINRLKERLEKAEQENLALQVSHALPDAESRQQARSRLDAVIADIDQMISALHE